MVENSHLQGKLISSYFALQDSVVSSELLNHFVLPLPPCIRSHFGAHTVWAAAFAPSKTVVFLCPIEV